MCVLRAYSLLSQQQTKILAWFLGCVSELLLRFVCKYLLSEYNTENASRSKTIFILSLGPRLKRGREKVGLGKGGRGLENSVKCTATVEKL